MTPTPFVTAETDKVQADKTVTEDPELCREQTTSVILTSLQDHLCFAPGYSENIGEP